MDVENMGLLISWALNATFSALGACWLLSITLYPLGMSANSKMKVGSIMFTYLYLAPSTGTTAFGLPRPSAHYV